MMDTSKDTTPIITVRLHDLDLIMAGDDGAAVEPEVARTARAVHLRKEGSGIVLKIL
jgi:hypothetical protein